MLINSMIKAKKFSSFIDEFVKTVNRENKERITWEYYIHRVFDRSYNDFCADLFGSSKASAPAADIGKTISDSVEIIKNFSPEERG